MDDPKGDLYEYEYKYKWVTPTVESNGIEPENLMKLQLHLHQGERYGFGVQLDKSKLICARGVIPQIQGSCGGDSGSPLIWFDNVTGRHQVIGIVSFGYKSCVNIHPDIFTRVSPYISWIEKNLPDFVDPHHNYIFINAVATKNQNAKWLFVATAMLQMLFLSDLGAK